MKRILSVLISAAMLLSIFAVTASAESKALPYNAEQLVNKSLAEIVNIMGGEYDVSCDDHNIAYTSTVIPYIYNDKLLPGMHFQLYSETITLNTKDRLYSDETMSFYLSQKDVKTVKNGIKNGKYRLSEINIVDSGKLNSKISANMRYNDITKALGSEFSMGTFHLGSLMHSYDTTAYKTTLEFYGIGEGARPEPYEPDVLRIKNPKLEVIRITPKQGFTYPSVKYIGDIDYDGKFTSADSLSILRASVKLDILTDEQLKLADVNGDGKIDSSDSLAVLRHSVNLKTNTKAGKKL